MCLSDTTDVTQALNVAELGDQILASDTVGADESWSQTHILGSSKPLASTSLSFGFPSNEANGFSADAPGVFDIGAYQLWADIESWEPLTDTSDLVPDTLQYEPNSGTFNNHNLHETPSFASAPSKCLPYQEPLTRTHFSDEAHLSTPVMGLVRAHITILHTIMGPGSSVETIWNPFATSPFQEPASTFAYTLSTPPLPSNYLPSAIQLATPHHPVFDVLPWPSVRDKLLTLMALPLTMRPRKMQTRHEEVVMALKFDMMDAAGGIRVQGLDPFKADNWEIGQKFFENWWWALDGDIVRRSNSLRRARGEAELRLTDRAC